MSHSRDRSPAPIAITSAARSLDDQHDDRRRKYLIMMGLRIVCVIAAASVFRASIWLALAFMVGGAVLPWCAVLIANDRPARNRTAFVGYRPPSAAKQLPRQTQAGQDLGADNDSPLAQPQRGDTGPAQGTNRPAIIEWLDPEHDT